MKIPWSVIGRVAARLVVWIAPRAHKSPKDLLGEAVGEGIKEVEKWTGEERRQNPTRTTTNEHVIPLIPPPPPAPRRPRKPAA